MEVQNILLDSKLTSSNAVNQELSKLLTLILQDSITSWFSALSTDLDLYVELSRTISTIVQEVERRLIKVDWVGLMVLDVPSILIVHLRDYRGCCERVGTSYAGGKSFEELFNGLQSHVALQPVNPTHEIGLGGMAGHGHKLLEEDYMRRVSELLMDALLPESQIQSDVIRSLVRELLCDNLVKFIDIVADADFLNETLLKMLRPDLIAGLSGGHVNSAVGEKYDESDTDILPDLNEVETVTVKEEVLFKPKVFKKRIDMQSTGNLFTNSLNKMTFGGLDKVSDKIKGLVSPKPSSQISSSTTSMIGKRRKSKGYPTLKITDEDPAPSSPSLSTPSSQPKYPIQAQTPFKTSTPLARRHSIDDGRRRRRSGEGVPLVPFISHVPEPKIVQNPIAQYFTSIASFFSFGWNLHRESIKGPWTLGPINTILHEHSNLESKLVELVAEVNEVNHNWIFTQLMFFITPVVHSIAGHVINRGIMKWVYNIISEDSITSYLEDLRLAFYPLHPTNTIIRSESEKARIRELLEVAILESDMLTYLPKDQITIERWKFLVDVWQSKTVNKHLAYILLDLMLERLDLV